MCKCISYNRPEDYQTDKGVILIPPFPNKPVGESEVPHKKVVIDFCIADVIQHIWKNGIYTLGSCCGHNKSNPNVILESNTTKETADKVRKIIKEDDGREWKIMSWILTEI